MSPKCWCYLEQHSRSRNSPQLQWRESNPIDVVVESSHTILETATSKYERASTAYASKSNEWNTKWEGAVLLPKSAMLKTKQPDLALRSLKPGWQSRNQMWKNLTTRHSAVTRMKSHRRFLSSHENGSPFTSNGKYRDQYLKTPTITEIIIETADLAATP